MNKRIYTSPVVEIAEVMLEKGFAASNVNGYAASGEAGMLNEGETYEW